MVEAKQKIINSVYLCLHESTFHRFACLFVFISAACQVLFATPSRYEQILPDNVIADKLWIHCPGDQYNHYNMGFFGQFAVVGTCIRVSVRRVATIMSLSAGSYNIAITGSKNLSFQLVHLG